VTRLDSLQKKNNKMAGKKAIFVDDVNFLVNDISNAYRRNNLFTDVSFVLSDGKTMQTNRFMLSCRSQYFATLLSVHKEEEVVMNCDSKIFQLLLDYIWEGEVDFSHLELKEILDLMKNAQIMCFERLVGSIQKNLAYLLESGELVLEDYWTLLDFCANNRFEEILNSALEFVDTCFKICVSEESFLQISTDAIFTLLENENRTAPEIDIFRALTLWLENQRSPLATSTRLALLGLVDLAAISPVDLIRVVRVSGYYQDKDICDALEKRIKFQQGKLSLGENEAKNLARTPNRFSFSLRKNGKFSSIASRRSVRYTSLPGSHSDDEEEIEEEYEQLLVEDEEEDILGASYKDDSMSSNTLVRWWRSRDSLLSTSSKALQ